MGTWLMKFEVKADIGIEASLRELVFKHPDGSFEVHLENHQMEPGCKSPSLHAYFLFQADGPDDAEVRGEKHCSQFLDVLVFTTGARFRAGRRIYVFDWSPGVDRRQGYVYNQFPDPNLPQLVLGQCISSSIELLSSADANADLRQAVHWFSAGVSAASPEEQFELFWFSIETIARFSRDKTKVPDRCAVCEEPLYCPSCEAVSTHRPYPSQSIQQLFARYISNDADQVYRMTSSMRHALLHGDRVSRVESEFNRTLPQLVDTVGKVARLALLNNLVSTVRQEGVVEMGFIEPNTFLHHQVDLRVHVAFESPSGRPPVFTDIPEFDLDLIARDQAADRGPTNA